MTDPAPAPAPAPAAPQPQPPPPANRVMWTVVLIAVALLGMGLVMYAWKLPPFSRTAQRTDNAYVRGQVTVIAPQVSGYVTQVAVQDFQTVSQGQLLARIDDRIYGQKLRQAQATLHAAQAALANSQQSQNSARGSVAQYQASIAGAQAQLVKARADADRAVKLKAGGWVAQSQVDITRAALRAAEATLAQARAQEGVASTSVTSAVVNKRSLEAAVENAQAQIDLAAIDLANTRITAPRAGRLGEITVRLGQQVAVGTQLMALVPDRIWVTANFKETQLKRIRVGQPATLAVDALDQTLTGHVERISPATGSEFSVIRPDNATGNFTKVAQRIPVRIAIDPGQPLSARLSPGMSVVVEVKTATR